MTNVAVSAAPFDHVSFDLGYNLRLSGRFNQYDAATSPAYSGLFLSASAVNSPYASLTDGGNYAGTTINLADGLDVRTGYSWLAPQYQQLRLTSGLEVATEGRSAPLCPARPARRQRGCDERLLAVRRLGRAWCRCIANRRIQRRTGRGNDRRTQCRAFGQHIGHRCKHALQPRRQLDRHTGVWRGHFAPQRPIGRTAQFSQCASQPLLWSRRSDAQCVRG